jgi:hypothetical protein
MFFWFSTKMVSKSFSTFEDLLAYSGRNTSWPAKKLEELANGPPLCVYAIAGAGQGRLKTKR